MIPKSKQAQNQVFMDLAKQGGLGPAIMEDSPRGEKLRTQLMEKLDLEPLESEEATELKKAKWENERIMKGEPVQVSPYDVAPIHLPCHIQKIQDPVFLENSTPEQFAALQAHIQEHKMAEQQKMMAQQAQAMAAQGIPPGMPAPQAGPGNPGMNAPIPNQAPPEGIGLQ